MIIPLRWIQPLAMLVAIAAGLVGSARAAQAGRAAALQCTRCGRNGHRASQCQWPLDVGDMVTVSPRIAAAYFGGQTVVRVVAVSRPDPAGPSQDPADTGRNEPEIAPVFGPRNS